MRIGDGMDPNTEMGPTVDEGQYKTVLKYIDIGREDGATLVCGVLSVLRVKNFEEAMQVANDTEYGLSSSIFSNDAARIFRFVDEIETGMTHINSPTTGGEAHIPFGGIKGTGIGDREQGSTALDFYTELKVVYVDYTGRKREGNLY
jgi:acyl-CoA reductase-like NAD-dependent aldehyde dehydrogenase